MREIQIKREIKYLDEDLLIIVTGGKSHIGCCVNAQAYQNNDDWHVTLNTWNKLSHKDDHIAKMYATAACLITHHVVSCICGIHYEDISTIEIQNIVQWCQKDIKAMEKELRK